MILTIGDLQLDEGRKSVLLHGRQLSLSPTAFDVLSCLMRKSPAVVSVDELLSTVWHNKVVNRDTVKQQIKSLRDQLGQQGTLVESVRGYGYRIKINETQQNITTESSQSWYLSRWFHVSLMLVMTSLAVVTAVTFNGKPEKEPSAAVLMLPLKVAVLPFTLLDSNDKAVPQFLQDELTTLLSRQEGFRAISVSAVDHAVHRGFSVDEYASQLDVDVLFEGSVREKADGYQINIRMVLTQNSIAVWRDSFYVTGKDRDHLLSSIKQPLEIFLKKKHGYLERRQTAKLISQ
ncbi:winged helix-turn-helix domain-containing protein [Marinicella sp. W31]|uniref:winged helix-turn-helix domain-containing protein n=1 Tax=Marinicella sp. W31 TaxID=3023713 RepID=UPI00375814E6